ncbi:ATP-dependent RNA helicase dbp7 [Aureobasidium melanogenum CBS 110374]|uniref:ATP-dependent RNA helicase n=1 Tax=Aureobasidium melanogenum (strain CBS 110374) TaxID=1043003 RepID=A0A074VKP0_AURM1|nr:ATP-dependent RNA helicase dbp7 [Aureobasidium melanogenum CBS 110374]KEQ59649.1 ATP-dependent RNA helicase dbp7 [Aureobasidium melanogenum CBS 110374]
MADDGMLLNFAVGDQPWAPKTTAYKGGRWKDRLTAKKALQYGQNKNNPDYKKENDAKNDVRSGSNSEPRPFKRQRTDGGEYKPTHTTGRTGPRDSTNAPRQRPKEVISSLFTYNPTATTAPVEEEEEAEDAEPIQPSNAPLSSELDTFTSLGLSPNVARHLLEKMGIKAPTAIQAKAVAQLVKDDSDAFIQAETGSGKTLAYLLPIVQRLVTMSETARKANGGTGGLTRDSGLFAIILAPTRELSKQISTVLESLLGAAHWIVAGTVIGGEKKQSEKARLRKGLNILVATPGRLVDHLEHTERLDVSNVRWLVLDEGDRLMELGFENDIQKIVSLMNLRMRKVQQNPIPGLPEKRTTVLCSATIKMDVERLGNITLKEAVSISAEKPRDAEDAEKNGHAFSAPAQLKQSYAVVPAKLRLVTLAAILRRSFARKGSVMKTIVFMSCADSVDFHFEVLTREKEKELSNYEKKLAPGKIRQGGSIDDACTEAISPIISGKDNDVSIFRMHGSLPQNIRTSTLKAFTNNKDASVMICTDVASRGLDLPNVDFVIEYDPAFSKDDHLHRIGRTARAGRDGRALIFLQPGNEEGYVDILKEDRRDAGHGLTRHDAVELLKKGLTPTTGTVSSGREWEEKATDWQLDVERWALENPKHLEQARRAYQSHIRAYATHVAAEREIFNIKTLHLGHLAKAFALRDKPGSIKVPGLRPGKDDAKRSKDSRHKANVKGAKSSGEKRSATDGDDGPQMTDAQEAARIMRAKTKAMMGGGASEFNLG